MAAREILLLGNENLYKICKEVSRDNIKSARRIAEDLHDTIIDFRGKYGFGRAIAAPQINELFRMIYMNFDNKSIALINPRLEFVGSEKFELWNDCTLDFSDDLSELIQHEYGHLDGILVVLEKQ